MNAFLFIIGFIWLLTAIGSVLLGPLIGFKRPLVKQELAAFWNANAGSRLLLILRRSALAVAYIGFLLPATQPVIGIVVGIAILSII